VWQRQQQQQQQQQQQPHTHHTTPHFFHTTPLNRYKEFTADVLPRIKAQGYNAIQLMAIQVCVCVFVWVSWCEHVVVCRE
jgi:1,4-alpha-glucan branching enzyme